MVVATKPGSLFFNILLFLLALGVGSGRALFSQLKMELNFGEKDNYIAFENVKNDPENRISFSKQFVQNGDFELSQFGETSPAGSDYLLLNGISYFFKLPPNADINLNGHVAYSVSTWIYLYSTGVNGEIINADNGFISGYRFFIEDNVPKLEIRENGREVFSSNISIQPARWNHIGFFCDGVGDSVIFYINGQPVNKGTFSKVTQVNTGSNSYVGAAVQSNAPNFLKANLDQLRLFAGRDTIFDNVRTLWAKTARVQAKKSRPAIPATFVLSQNYPNPFNLSTRISFELKTNGYVELSIYDLLGNTIATLFQGQKATGVYEFSWDGTDNNSNVVPSGIYFVRLVFNGTVQTKKMVLVK
jgi:hypothetical protein